MRVTPFLRFATAACLSSLMLAMGCQVSLRKMKPTRLPPDDLIPETPYYQPGTYAIGSAKQTATDSLTVQYLGCGGLYIRHKNQALLVDPFFSNFKALVEPKLNSRKNRLSELARRRSAKIKPHTPSVDLGYNLVRHQPNFAPPSAILVTHGHYDHLLDVPYLINNCFENAPMPTVYGNLSVTRLLKELVPADKLYNLEPHMATAHQSGNWQVLGDSNAAEYIRFLPIEADHAPHVKSLKLYDGEAFHAIPRGNYYTGTPMNQWLEGRTLSYLVDLMKDGKIAYRIFIQTSAATPPRGLVPEAIRKQKDTNLAILCVASYTTVSEYPREWLVTLKPKAVMLIHWEDFVTSTYKRTLTKPRTVSFTRVDEFIEALQRIRKNDALQFRYYLPKPSTKANVYY